MQNFTRFFLLLLTWAAATSLFAQSAEEKAALEKLCGTTWMAAPTAILRV